MCIAFDLYFKEGYFIWICCLFLKGLLSRIIAITLSFF